MDAQPFFFRCGPGVLLPILAAALLPATAVAQPAPESPVPGESTAYTLHFDARVGDAPFACGTRYELNGVGIEGRDLRFYVSDIHLVDGEGRGVPLALDQDGLWQYQGVALLDFEDGTAGCRNGTPQTRNVVTGIAPAGDYRTVRFTLGVPMELNHINQATAPSPLSLTALFWSWNAGYKFLRAEVLSDGLPLGFFVHLGSTRCMPEGRASEPATHCQDPNRLTVELPWEGGSADRIVFDLAALLEGTDLAGDGETQRGACMSSPQDARCAPIFKALGLPFPDVPEGPQRVFRMEREDRVVGASGEGDR